MEPTTKRPRRGLAAGVFCGQAVELRDALAVAVFLLHEDAAAEGIRKRHVRTGLEILAGHLPHHLGLAGVEFLGAAARLQTVLLQESAGSPVRNHKLAALQPLNEGCRTASLIHNELVYP